MPKFVDAQRLKMRRPNSFEAPTEAQIRSIAPGFFIKVCSFNERFWIRVTKIETKIFDAFDTKFTGVISNDLVGTEHGLARDMEITVLGRNIYNIMHPQDA